MEEFLPLANERLDAFRKIGYLFFVLDRQGKASRNRVCRKRNGLWRIYRLYNEEQEW